MSFFLGIVVHYITDASWHGLDSSYNHGFIQTLGTSNYGCRGDLCQVAHNSADTGGEFVAAYQLDMWDTWHDYMNWYLPTEELVEVYKFANESGYPIFGEVEPQWIENCGKLFKLAQWAEGVFGTLIFPIFADEAPFLVEHMLDHFHGGHDDGAMWTNWMWVRFIDWMENGLPDEDWGAPCGAWNCDSIPREEGRTAMEDERAKSSTAMDERVAARQASKDHRRDITRAVSNLLELERFGESPVAVSKNGRGVDLKVDLSAVGPRTLDELTKSGKTMVELLRSRQLTLAVGNTDGQRRLHARFEEVHNSGAIRAAAAKALGMNVDGTAATDGTLKHALGEALPSQVKAWSGAQSHEYFGTSLAVGDFNGDGKQETQ